MKLFNSAKLLLLLGLLMLVSALAGFLLGHRIARKQYEVRNDPSNWNEHVASEFDRIVHPTAEQGVRIKASLNDAVRQLQAIRLETINRSTNVIWHLIAEVEKELTPEQQKAFEQMKPRPADLNLDVLQVKPPEPSADSAPGKR